MSSPGFPNLLNGFTPPSPTLLLQDAFDVLTGQNIPQWGIFLDGDAVIAADNVISVEYKQDWSISDYPVENGGFQSYDKVSSPFDLRIRFSRGGSTDDRTELLQSLDQAAQPLTLYDAVTPEQVYSSMNITHYDYHRTSSNGAGLLTADVWLTEVRVTAQAAFSNTAQPSGADAKSDGTVQTSPPTDGQSESALSSLADGG